MPTIFFRRDRILNVKTDPRAESAESVIESYLLVMDIPQI